MKKLILILSILPVVASSQIKTLSSNEVVGIVLSNHPLAKQIQLLIPLAEANLKEQQGAMDMVLNYDAAQKQVANLPYYFTNDAQLTLPTWLGPEVYANVQNNGWDRLSSELTPGTTAALGFKLPILKDLMIDKRRAAIKQSRVAINSSIQERLLLLNELLYDALYAYWNWTQQYAQLNIANNIVSTNVSRIDMVKKQYKQGERAAIDTLDAFNQLQSMRYVQTAIYQNYLEACYNLGNYLFINDSTNIVPDLNLIPDSNWQTTTNNLLLLADTAMNSLALHPKIKSYSLKGDMLEIDKRLKRQNLLPKLDLKYNLINKITPTITNSYLLDNYNYGIGFNLPLQRRAAKGAYEAVKLKIQQNNYAMQNETVMLNNKIRTAYNDMVQSYNQINLLSNIFDNSLKLLSAEETRFQLGESSLFVINSRENKVLESNLKLMEARAKFYKHTVSYKFAKAQLVTPN